MYVIVVKEGNYTKWVVILYEKYWFIHSEIAKFRTDDWRELDNKVDEWKEEYKPNKVVIR